ncbi:MAG: imidazolonepropionase [Rhodocyclaceae bacterium]
MPPNTPAPAAMALWRNARIATLAPPAPSAPDDWGLIDDGAIVTIGAEIAWVGHARDVGRELPARLARAGSHDAAACEEHDLGGALLTPGLIDCHTHLVYGGRRSDEFEQRLNGASYEDIARAGGGIRATVAATRAATDAELLASAARRAQALMAGGVTTLEIKSGYGLAADHEARCLRIARHLTDATGVNVRSTCLSAHALPPEFEGRADAYVDAVCDWLPALHAEGLVDAVDAFCERIAFSPQQTRRVFETASQLGLPVKLHAEQLSDQGGAQLAAEFGALSCDHLEYLSDAGIAAMRAAGTVAVLLPGAFHFLRETRLPPVAGLRAAGVPMAIATDHNPGSSPTLSLPLMAHLACMLFGFTPLEAVRGMTTAAARALGLADRGHLAAGLRADFALWSLDHPNELAYWFGSQPCAGVVIGGRRHPGTHPS